MKTKKLNTDPSPIESQLKETKLSSELVFKGNFLKVLRDEVQLPDKKKALREYIIHPGAALIIPILADGQLVMVEQYRYAVRKVFLEFPAGKKDRNESFEKAAKRELLEEVGYAAKSIKYLTTIHPVIGYANEEIQIFLATDLIQKKQNLDSGEFLNVVYLTLAELEKKVWAGELTDVKTQIAYFWLAQNLMGRI